MSAPMAGGLLWHALIVAVLFVTMVAPLLRGARPVRIWLVACAACLLLMAAMVARGIEVTRGGDLAVTDLTYLGGFGLQLIWLGLLVRHVSLGDDGNASLDSFTAAAGTALGVWVSLLAPLAGGGHLPAELLWGLYPVVDLAILTMTVHLWIRLGRGPVSLLIYLASMSVQLVLDVLYAVAMATTLPIDLPLLLSAYVAPGLGLAVAACHPSVVELSRVPVGHREAERHSPLLIFAGAPAVLAVAFPVTGTTDGVVRGALVATILGLLFVRLSRAISELTRSRAESHRRAMHDGLTGLLNRTATFEEIRRRLAADSGRGRYTAVVFIDCDHFKHVNDTWGHRAGDELLNAVARRLVAVVGAAGCLPDDAGAGDLPVVGRHGGDEFVVVLDVEAPERAESVARTILAAFDQPLRVQPGRRHVLTPSMGIAVAAPGEAVETEELVARADAAMYRAKLLGRRRWVVFDEALAAEGRRRADVADRIADAVQEGLFTLALQPVIGVAGPHAGRLYGWEALARWHDPVLGDVSPAVFVPLAEEWGLIGDLGERILRLACRDLARLRAESPGSDPSVSVNVSAAQLLQPDFAERVESAVTRAGLPPRCLTLEITESMLVDRGPRITGVLGRLHEAGVGLWLDDFGTGYASIATLVSLPLDGVKLDRSLTRHIDEDPAARRRLAAVLDLVDAIGIGCVVAEGVERQEQAEVLRELECPLAQGWWFGRPAPVEDVARLPIPPVSFRG